MIFRTLFSWLRRRFPPRPTGLTLVVYTRPGCHLCEEAWRYLQGQQRRYSFTLEERDVDAEPELAGQYGEWVPVVAVNGKVRFRGRINPVLLERLLHAAAGGR
jgi:glutaredoxin